MKRVDIKTGFKCNNHCKFCIQGNKREFKAEKTTEEVKKILSDNIKDFDCIVFTGGEVTIRKDLIELVRFAKKLNYKFIQIQSNGRMFYYEDFCKRLIEAGATEFCPAIHGSTKEMHDSLTRAEGSFKQTLQGIKNLIKLNQKVITNSVITKINYKDLPNIAKLLSDIGVYQIQFAFMHINSVIQKDQTLIDEIVPRYKDVKEYVEKALQIGMDANIKVMAEAFPFCILEKYQDRISENYIPETIICEDKLVTNFKEMKQKGAKLKGPKCSECKYFNKCEGPWSDYAEIFGFDEFTPIK